MTYNIELARVEDAPAIHALQKQAYLSEAALHNDYSIPPLHQTLNSVVEEFREGIVLKAVHNGQLIGSVRAFREADTCYVGKLIVAASLQNRGIGQGLMQAIENYFPQARQFELFTGYKSEKNLFLYHKLGYREIRRQAVSEKLTLVFLQKSQRENKVNNSIEMNMIFETARVRVRVREFSLDDTAFVIELLNSPGWQEYIGQRDVKTKEQAESYLQNGPFKSYREHGFGLWLVEKKDGPEAIGMCGIIKRDPLENPDIGFAFLPEHAGKGYAFEAASATLSFAGDRLGISTMWAVTLPNNKKSIRLLEKIGLTFIRTVTFPGGQEELCLYSN